MRYLDIYQGIKLISQAKFHSLRVSLQPGHAINTKNSLAYSFIFLLSSESHILHTNHPHTHTAVPSLWVQWKYILEKKKSFKCAQWICARNLYSFICTSILDLCNYRVSSSSRRVFQLHQGKTSSVTVKMDISVYSLHTSVFPIKPSPVCGHEHPLFPKWEMTAESAALVGQSKDGSRMFYSDHRTTLAGPQRARSFRKRKVSS